MDALRAVARWASVAGCVLAAGCASAPRSPDGFTFAVMGDTPYSPGEERPLSEMIERMNGEPLAFVVHVGDIKAGSRAPCTDELFAKRRAQLDASSHPMVYTPGDNEWTDCRRKSNGGGNPLERLAKLREMFFEGRASLGQGTLETTAQTEAAPGCGAYPENRSWSYGRVRFVTVNVPGSHNNEGFDADSDAEARCRNEANARWIDQAAGVCETGGERALVIATQADPWDADVPAYRRLIAQVGEVARRLGRPVLFVHGDTHRYRFDAPFTDASGKPIGNARRLETYGSPFVGWVRVVADPDDPAIFRPEPMLEALVPSLPHGAD